MFGRDEFSAIKAGHRTVDVHVRRLREHLEPFRLQELIQAVRGFGYRFREPGRVRNGRAQAAATEPKAISG